ncbi:hypothetical protein QTP86_027340, partial [Hemibagrus guttatus]
GNITVVSSFISFEISAEKESVCCKEVSSKKITLPITGFKVQAERPPCVKAVIFYTSKGAVCSHWREDWVLRKVTELRKLQAINKRLKMNTTTAPQMADSTYSSNSTLNY